MLQFIKVADFNFYLQVFAFFFAVFLGAVDCLIDTSGKVYMIIFQQDHIEHCIVDAVEHGDKEAIKELEVAIDRFVK